MCVEPTTALMIASVASSAIQYQQGVQAQKAQYQAQVRQNQLAKANAIQRYSAEQLKIRQVVAQNMQKGYEASKKAKATTATYIASAGDAGGLALSGSTQALIRDYYRTEGNYKNSLMNNLNINISQYERNMEAIQFGQESQSTYVQPPNPELLFASQALNVANTYYSLEYMKEIKGLQSNTTKQKNLSQLDILNT